MGKVRMAHCIIELFGHCKCGNLNIHILACFSFFNCSMFYLFGKDLVSHSSQANMHAFHENHDRIYTELTFINS